MVSTLTNQPDKTTIPILFPSSNHEIVTQGQLGISGYLRTKNRKRQRRQTPAPSSSPTSTYVTAFRISFGRHSNSQQLGGGGFYHMPTIANYSSFLAMMLLLWVAYLILPQGLRRHLCNAHRKRYKKSKPGRIIQPLGGRIRQSSSPRTRLHNQRRGWNVSRTFSSEDDGSSVTSTLNRGNRAFMSVKRGGGSPLSKSKSKSKSKAVHPMDDEGMVVLGRSNSGVSSERRRSLSRVYSSDLSSNDSSIPSDPYHHHHQQQQQQQQHQNKEGHSQNNESDLLTFERNKFVSNNDSSDLSSILSSSSKNDKKIETLSTTGSAIWGTPKRFIQKRIMDEKNTAEDRNKHAGQQQQQQQQQQVDLLSDNNHVNDTELHIKIASMKENGNSPPPALSEVDSFASAFYSTKISTSSSSSNTSHPYETTTTTTTTTTDDEPSPIHPDLTCGHNVPSHMVLSSTLLSFRDPGIRLFAHGTQCQPRRIWIRLDVTNEQLSWRTENNMTPSSNNELNNDPDLVTLGQTHFIPLIQILFIDVGKTTAALQMLDIHDDLCFSILTDGGSLDLQASNKVERDAFVSCMCLILDTVYNHLPPEKSWRRLNDGVGSSADGSSSMSSLSGGLKAPSGSTSSSYRSNENYNGLPCASSSSTGTGSVIGSDVFHGVDLGSQVSATFGEI